jgi:hypothetical protein
MGQGHMRRALLADRAGQAAGVDAADADPARAAEPPTRSSVARQFDGSVGSHFTTMPAATGSAVSSSSAVTPVLPIWGKVKVTTWPA